MLKESAYFAEIFNDLEEKNVLYMSFKNRIIILITKLV